MMSIRLLAIVAVAGACCVAVGGVAEETPLTYRHFDVQEAADRVVATKPIPVTTPPRWAQDVSQQQADWSAGPAGDEPFFLAPIPFVAPAVDEDEPFHSHNHQPSITWLPNGDLLAIWYSTGAESGTELTVLASRLRRGQSAWDPASEFFKAPDRNMHGSSIFHDGQGTLYHFNGMGPKGARGWAKLALLMRSSSDSGVTWTPPQVIGPELSLRHQVISGTLMTDDGVLIQPCDAVSGPHGGTALHLSHDHGKTWTDPGAGKPAPQFVHLGTGEGTIAGIHAGVVSLQDGSLLALGRGDAIDDRMPMSRSHDHGKTWTYMASEFPPIGGGQRLVLKRLQEGPLLLISFTSHDRHAPEANGMTFTDAQGDSFVGHGMYAALSLDEGKSWPIRKLLTPGEGQYDGGAHTGPFTATATRAEHAGYLACTQTPDGVIQLISSRLHYRFNLDWVLAGATPRAVEGTVDAFLGEPKMQMQQLFTDERFPNLVVAIDGTVLATWGNKRVRVRRSEDGGETWGDDIVVADPGFQGGGTTVDETSGDILTFVEERHPPAALTIYRSGDHGKTWQAQSHTVIKPDSLGNQPSMHMNEHGITLRHGPHQGRLLRPSRFYAAGNSKEAWPDHYTNAIYSDDGGRTWQTSDPFPENGTGEAAVAELSDGRVIYNSRVHWDQRPENTRRRSAWSDDGGHSWQGWQVIDILPDGDPHRSYGCMGGMVRLPVAGRDILLFSNIDTPNATRERATVWASFDGGKSWPVKRLVYDGPSAYSSLNAGRPGTASEGWIYLLFEGGPEGGGQLARFNLAWLLAGEATGDGEVPSDWLR